MYLCPVCGKENTTLQCACGFDMSRDYESYPTLAPLKAGMPSRVAFGKKLKDLHRCKGCGGLLFYFNPVKGVCVCAACGQEVAVSTPKAVSATTPVAPEKPAEPPKNPATEKVITYDAYMRALEQLFLVGGKKPLSQYQIDNFLRENQLDKRFNISAGDIRRDLETIYAKYKPQTSSNQINTYDSYMKALENLYLQNGKKPLSQTQIQEFLVINNLGKKFGITATDVDRDMKSIEEKYKQYGNLANILQKKTTKDTASLSSLLSQLGKKK